MKPTTQITTRIDNKLAADLLTIAMREKRSLSAQIALIVEQFLAEQKKVAKQSKAV